MVMSRAHMHGHYKSLMLDTAAAFRRAAIPARLLFFTSEGMPLPDDWRDQGCAVFPSIPWWVRIFSPATVRRVYRNQREHWTDLLIESFCCAWKAMRLRRQFCFAAVLFLDGMTLVGSLFAILCRCRVVYMCSVVFRYDDPHLPLIGRVLLRCIVPKALKTGRLMFFFKTPFGAEESRPALGDHVVYIPEAVTLVDDLPTREEARRRLGLAQDETVLLLFGAHRVTKDYRTVFQSAAMLTPRPLLLFVGPPGGNDPRAAAEASGYTRCKMIIDFVPEKDVILYFRCANAVILPYVKTTEGGGSNVLMLAYKFDCPIIATHNIFFDYHIKRFHCGFQFSSGNAEELATCMRRIACLDKETERSLQEGLALARQAHAWENVVSQYRALLGI